MSDDVTRRTMPEPKDWMKSAAWMYLDGKTQDREWGREGLVGGEESTREARADLYQMPLDGDNVTNMEAWCSRWLTDTGWRRLLAALRQKRRRSGNRVTTVTVSHDSAMELRWAAERYNVTQDQALQMALEALRDTEPDPDDSPTS